LALSELPPHHKDPFDRLLIAQAIAEDTLLVSADEMFAKYAVQLLW
jgi:PIN domain nuclease of toxin-antitoxin system